MSVSALRLLPAALSLACATALGQPVEEFPVLETLVTPGTPIAGREEVVLGIDEARVNRSGAVAFSASFGDAGSIGSSNRGVFLLEGGEVRMIEDITASNSFPSIDVNDRGSVALTVPDHVSLHRGGVTEVVARSGDPAPGTNQLYGEFLVVRGRILDEADGLIFYAELADSRQALYHRDGAGNVRLVALEGAEIPGLAGTTFGPFPIVPRPQLVAGRVLFEGSPTTLSLWEDGRLETLLVEGTSAPSGALVDHIGLRDLSPEGVVAVALLSESPGGAELYLWQDGVFTLVTGPAANLPGLDAPAAAFGSVYLDQDSQLLFSVHAGGGGGGLFLRDRQGTLTAAVVDGQRLASGEPLAVSVFPPPGPFPSLEELLLRVVRPRDAANFVFHARVAATGVGAFLWSRGRIERIPESSLLRLVAASGELLDFLDPLELDGQGRIYLRGSFCCRPDGVSLLRADFNASRVEYLPFLASSGERGGSLRWDTVVDFFNPDFLEAPAELQLYSAEGLPVARDDSLLAPATAVRFEAGGLAGSAVGHGSIEAPGIRGLSAAARFQIRRDGVLVSQSAIASQTPARQHRFLVDDSDGGVSSVGVSNPSEQILDIRLELRDSNSALVGEANRQLPPRGRLAERLSTLFPGVDLDGFLGRIEVRSEAPSLAVGFRQNGLLTSFLAPLRAPEPVRDWALEPVAVRSQAADTSFRRFRSVQARGSQVLVYDIGSTIHLITPDRVIAVNDPPAGSPYYDLTPVSFSAAGEIVFMARRRSDDRFELVRWLAGESETLLEEGVLVGGLEAPFPPFPGAIDGSEAGVVLGRDRLALLSGGRLTILLSGQQRIPGSQDRWERFSLVDLNDAGDVAFWAQGVLALVRDGSVRVLARSGQPLGAGLPVVESVGNFQLTEQGEVYLAADTGFFVYSGDRWRALLLRGDPAPGFSDQLVSSVHSFRVAENGEAAVFATLEPNPDIRGDGGALFAVSSFRPARLLAADRTFRPAEEFLLTRLTEFAWNDAGWLVFTGFDLQGRPVLLRTLDGSPVQHLITGDLSPATAYSRRPARVREFTRIWSVDAAGRPLVDAEVSGESGSGLFRALPGNPHRLYFPHLVSGRWGPFEYQSRLLLHNSGEDAAAVVLELLDEAGIVRDRQAAFVPPAGTEAISLEMGESFAGWARLKVAGGRVDATARLNLRRDGRLSGEVSIPSRLPTTEGVLLAEDGARVLTGIAVANPYPRTVEVTFELLAPDPEQTRRAVLRLGPHQQRAVLFSELFVDSAEGGRRPVRFESPFPVPVIALTLEESILTSIPLRIESRVALQ